MFSTFGFFISSELVVYLSAMFQCLYAFSLIFDKVLLFLSLNNLLYIHWMGYSPQVQ